jgi:hypothetical protein
MGSSSGKRKIVRRNKLGTGGGDGHFGVIRGVVYTVFGSVFSNLLRRFGEKILHAVKITPAKEKYNT